MRSVIWYRSFLIEALIEQTNSSYLVIYCDQVTVLKFDAINTRRCTKHGGVEETRVQHRNMIPFRVEVRGQIIMSGAIGKSIEVKTIPSIGRVSPLSFC